MKALYTLQVWGQFSCRIPKKNGKGYLKSAMGGHHINEDSRKFTEIMDRDICDIDGYLSISMSDKREEAEIREALEKVFPRITHWEQVKDIEVLYFS